MFSVHLKKKTIQIYLFGFFFHEKTKTLDIFQLFCHSRYSYHMVISNIYRFSLSVKLTVRLYFVDFLLILPIVRRVIKAQLSMDKTKRKMTKIQTFQLVLPIGKWTLFVCIMTTIYRQNNFNTCFIFWSICGSFTDKENR